MSCQAGNESGMNINNAGVINDPLDQMFRFHDFEYRRTDDKCE